jgi:hypothetical protein
MQNLYLGEKELIA